MQPLQGGPLLLQAAPGQALGAAQEVVLPARSEPREVVGERASVHVLQDEARVEQALQELEEVLSGREEGGGWGQGA